MLRCCGRAFYIWSVKPYLNVRLPPLTSKSSKSTARNHLVWPLMLRWLFKYYVLIIIIVTSLNWTCKCAIRTMVERGRWKLTWSGWKKRELGRNCSADVVRVWNRPGIDRDWIVGIVFKTATTDILSGALAITKNEQEVGSKSIPQRRLGTFGEPRFERGQAKMPHQHNCCVSRCTNSHKWSDAAILFVRFLTLQKIASAFALLNPTQVPTHFGSGLLYIQSTLS